MWDNKVLKQKAKERMKVNYWKMLLVGLIIALVSGGTGASSSARNYVTGDKETTQYDDYDEDAFFSGGDIDPDMMVDSLGFWGLFGGMMLGVVVVAVIIGICLAIFVLNPLEIGARRFFYRNINEKAELKEVGFGFDRNYLGNVKTMFLRDLYTVLWSMRRPKIMASSRPRTTLATASSTSEVNRLARLPSTACARPVII